MKRLKLILIEVLGIEEKDINDGLSPDAVETWDSFNGLMLVSELENVFKIKFTMDEVVAVKCVADIKAALLRHGVELSSD